MSYEFASVSVAVQPELTVIRILTQSELVDRWRQLDIRTGDCLNATTPILATTAPAVRDKP